MYCSRICPRCGREVLDADLVPGDDMGCCIYCEAEAEEKQNESSEDDYEDDDYDDNYDDDDYDDEDDYDIEDY